MTLESAFSGAVGRLSEVDPARRTKSLCLLELVQLVWRQRLLMRNSALDAQMKGAPARFRETRADVAKAFERLCGFTRTRDVREALNCQGRRHRAHDGQR